MKDKVKVEDSQTVSWRLCHSTQPTTPETQNSSIPHTARPMLHTCFKIKAKSIPCINTKAKFPYKNKKKKKKKNRYLSNSVSNTIYTRFGKWCPVVPQKFLIHGKLKAPSSKEMLFLGFYKKKSKIRIRKAKRNVRVCQEHSACRLGGPCRSGGGERKQQIGKRRRFRPRSLMLRLSISLPWLMTFSF